MEPIRSRIHHRAGTDVDTCNVPPPAVTKHRPGGNTPAQTPSRLSDAEARADAIGRAAPFSAWPRDVLLRLAAACSVSSHPSEASLIVKGERCDHITVVAEGTVLSSSSTSGGRRLTYKIDNAAFSYGWASLADGLPLQIDLVADGPVTVVRIPIATVRAELTRMPALWESVAVETIRRSRRYATQLNQLVLDTPRVRAASLLMGLLAQTGKVGIGGAVTIDVRLSQERLADMLGVSRQWATAVVRELARAGIVEWRYGRVTVLDVQALRSLAAQGADAMFPPSERLAPQQPVDRAPALLKAASGGAAGGGTARRRN
jgi:CRP-like cAMP-binding protein